MNGKHLFIIPTRIPSIPVERVLLSRLTTSHTSETDTSLMNMLPTGLGGTSTAGSDGCGIR
ncbi:hypothetical protein J6590_095334, partial [Homalodisca vitripennis]